MHDLDEVSDLGEAEEEEEVFVPLRPNDRSGDYYEETQRSFQELRLQREEDSALARQAMDRELEKLHRLFFRQDFMGSRARHQRRQRRRVAVSDTSSSSDTDAMDLSASLLREPFKPRSTTPGPRLGDTPAKNDTLGGRSDPRRSLPAKDKSRLPAEGSRRKRMCKENKAKALPPKEWTAGRGQHCGAVSG